MTDAALPLVDVGAALRGYDPAARRAAGRRIDAACREIGFFCVVGHDVPAELVAGMRLISRAFFDRPLAEKLSVKVDPQPGAAGYMAMGEHALAQTHGETRAPDLNELMTIGPVDVPDAPYFRSEAAQRWFVRNKFPERPPEFRATWCAYYRAMSAFGNQLMRLAALGLGLPETWFDDKLDRQISRLAVREYPLQHEALLPGQLRAAAHTDFGALTLLMPEDKPGGLQICSRDGDWLDVRAPAGVYVVNIGDMMAQWTNHAWVSTLHRVANPPDGADPGARRQSLVFFQIPNFDAAIDCIPTCADAANPPRHAPIAAGEYYLAKVAQMRKAAPAP